MQEQLEKMWLAYLKSQLYRHPRGNVWLWVDVTLMPEALYEVIHLNAKHEKRRKDMKHVIKWIEIEKSKTEFSIHKKNMSCAEVQRLLERTDVSSNYVLLELKDVFAEEAFQIIENMQRQDKGEQAHLGLILLSAFLAQSLGFESSGGKIKERELPQSRADKSGGRPIHHTSKESKQKLMTNSQQNCLFALLKSKKRLQGEQARRWLLESCGVPCVDAISRVEASQLIQKLNKC